MTTTNPQNIGSRIRQIREKRQMNLTDLSRISGVSRGYLYLLEKGENSPTQEKLAAIAKALNVMVSELIGEIESSDDLPNISPSLQQFAKEHNLPPADVIVLSKINYRGRRPQNATEWGILYSVIRGTLDKE